MSTETTICYTARISRKGYWGAERHESLQRAWKRAEEIIKLDCVCVRCGIDGKRFSVEDLRVLFGAERKIGAPQEAND